jgi:mannose-6-phosphate isomerase-like protein (cupin superfamily)
MLKDPITGENTFSVVNGNGAAPQVTEAQLLNELPADFYIPPITLLPNGSKIELPSVPAGMKTVELAGVGSLVCPEDWPVLNEPVTHTGSEAVYFLNEHVTANRAHFLAFLQGETSLHAHITTELCFLLEGQASMEGRPMGPVTVIPPGARHQITSSGAVILSVLTDVSDDPRTWHIPIR